MLEMFVVQANLCLIEKKEVEKKPLEVQVLHLVEMFDFHYLKTKRDNYADVVLRNQMGIKMLFIQYLSSSVVAASSNRTVV